MLNAKAPLVARVTSSVASELKLHQILMALMNDGKANLDHSVIVTFIEQMYGVKISKRAAVAVP